MPRRSSASSGPGRWAPGSPSWPSRPVIGSCLHDVDAAAIERGRERIRAGLERRAGRLDLDPDSADDVGRRAPRPASSTTPVARRRRGRGRPRHRGRARGPRGEAGDLPGARRGRAPDDAPGHQHQRPVGRRRSPRRRAPGARARAALLQPGAGHAARRGRRGGRDRRRPSSTAPPSSSAAWGKDAGPLRRHARVHRQPGQPAVHARGAARCSRRARRASTAIDAAIARRRLPDGPVRADGPRRHRRQSRRRARRVRRTRRAATARRAVPAVADPGAAGRRAASSAARPAAASTATTRTAGSPVRQPASPARADAGRSRCDGAASSSGSRWRSSTRRTGRSATASRPPPTSTSRMRLGAGHPVGPVRARRGDRRAGRGRWRAFASIAAAARGSTRAGPPGGRATTGARLRPAPVQSIP